MVRRDRISELIARRERSGRRGGRFPDLQDLADLQDAFDNYTGPKELFASLLPARIVTLLEVFCRYWIQTMIDHGTPYDERAINLKADVKYDLALVRSLQGKSITLGLLLSNSVKLTSLETIAAVFSDLIQADFFEWLSKVRERFSIEHDGDKAVPIIQDLEKTKRMLARTFDVRHILVHEFPEKPAFSISEIGQMISAATIFINAADEGFTQLLYGLYPLGQQDANLAARQKREAVEEELTGLLADIRKETGGGTILEVQKKWRAFARAEADRVAEAWAGGTMYPFVYETAYKVLASDRIRQLRSWLDEARGQYIG